MLNEIAASGNTAKGVANFQDFRDVELTVVMTGFSGTIKFVGSNADLPPDFSSAASLTNPYDYVKTVNQIDGSSVAGGTGLVGTATTSVTNLEVNTNAFKWIGAIVTSVTGGTLSLFGKGYDNT